MRPILLRLRMLWWLWKANWSKSRWWVYYGPHGLVIVDDLALQDAHPVQVGGSPDIPHLAELVFRGHRWAPGRVHYHQAPLYWCRALCRTHKLPCTGFKGHTSARDASIYHSHPASCEEYGNGLHEWMSGGEEDWGGGA